MNEQEILEKYKEIINSGIEKYYQIYNIKGAKAKQRFAEKYKANFAKGVEEDREEVSRKLLLTC